MRRPGPVRKDRSAARPRRPDRQDADNRPRARYGPAERDDDGE